MKLNLNFQRSGGLEKNPFCGGGMDLFWENTIELKGKTTITSGNAGMWKPWSSNTLKTLRKIWKVKLLPKPVGRAANTSFLRTTCSTINLCSGFKSWTSGKYFRLSEIASLMSSLVETRSTIIFQQLIRSSSRRGKAYLCESIGDLRPHTCIWMKLGKFSFWYPDESIRTSYTTHQEVCSKQTIVTDYDTLWLVRKRILPVHFGHFGHYYHSSSVDFLFIYLFFNLFIYLLSKKKELSSEYNRT